MDLTPAQKDALASWYQAARAAEKAKKLIAHEQALRANLFGMLHLDTAEGTHKAELPDGWQLKYKTPYVRKVDARVVESLRAPLAALRVSLDSVIEWKPGLNTDAYRELTAEARALLDTCLTTTPGAPAVELVPPKED